MLLFLSCPTQINPSKFQLGGDLAAGALSRSVMKTVPVGLFQCCGEGRVVHVLSSAHIINHALSTGDGIVIYIILMLCFIAGFFKFSGWSLCPDPWAP